MILYIVYLIHEHHHNHNHIYIYSKVNLINAQPSIFPNNFFHQFCNFISTIYEK